MVRTNKPSDMAVDHQISHAHESRKVYIHRIWMLRSPRVLYSWNKTYQETKTLAIISGKPYVHNI